MFILELDKLLTKEKCPELINLMGLSPFVPRGFRSSGSCFNAALLSLLGREKTNIPVSQLLISVWTWTNQLLSWRKWNIDWHEENVVSAAAEVAIVVKSWFLSLQRPVFFFVTSSHSVAGLSIKGWPKVTALIFFF